jgi:hypothetical protein
VAMAAAMAAAQAAAVVAVTVAGTRLVSNDTLASFFHPRHATHRVIRR